MNDPQPDPVAQTAMAAWGVNEPELRLISHRENAVFETRLADGRRAALRLHRPGYNSTAAINSELQWTLGLADAGFPVPTPIPALDGSLLVTVSGDQAASMISWVEGAPIGVSQSALGGTQAEQAKLYQRIGALLANLHDITDRLELPAGFIRHNWDRDGFLGEHPHWGKFWESPALDEAETTLLLTARARAFDELTSYQAAGADMGLIHADALRENVFRSGNNLTLIDFDDCGFGFRLYDLAVALSQSFDDENYAALSTAIQQGYSTIRPLSALDINLLPLFAMLRTFASLGWAIPRMPGQGSEARRYADRAIKAAKRYLEA